MANSPTVPLSPITIRADSPEFREICTWPFAGADSFILRLLKEDIPQRMLFLQAQFWIYRNPAHEIVGFAGMEISDIYQNWTSARRHPYISLLAVNPQLQSRGYGTSITQHLIGEAAVMVASDQSYSDVLFLDVYTTSEKAIALYKKCKFEILTVSPIPDHDIGKEYLVMAKRISIAGTTLFDNAPSPSP